MTSFNKVFVGFMALCMFIIWFSARSEVNANRNNREYYPRTAVVTEIDVENDMVYVTDYCGFIWGFSGVEDWDVDDVASMILHDVGQKDNILDDEIVNVQYSGDSTVSWKRKSLPRARNGRCTNVD